MYVEKGDKMSYITCISVRQYESKEEKEKVHAIAFSKLIEYVYGDFGTGYSRFMAKEWIREQFNPNIDNYIIDGTYQIGEFIDKNTGFIPENLIQQFYKEFGHDVLHGIPDEDTEGLRIVTLTKQNLIELIRERCEIIGDELKDKTKFVDIDYENLSPKRQKVFVTDLLKAFRNESSNWKRAAKYVRLDEKGRVCWTPCVVDQSYRDEISWLSEIVNNYNWDCIDVILCGY